jgi:hypothetical protein
MMPALESRLPNFGESFSYASVDLMGHESNYPFIFFRLPDLELLACSMLGL